MAKLSDPDFPAIAAPTKDLKLLGHEAGATGQVLLTDLPAATVTDPGLMSAADKTKLDGLGGGDIDFEVLWGWADWHLRPELSAGVDTVNDALIVATPYAGTLSYRIDQTPNPTGQDVIDNADDTIAVTADVTDYPEFDLAGVTPDDGYLLHAVLVATNGLPASRRISVPFDLAPTLSALTTSSVTTNGSNGRLVVAAWLEEDVPADAAEAFSAVGAEWSDVIDNPTPGAVAFSPTGLGSGTYILTAVQNNQTDGSGAFSNFLTDVELVVVNDPTFVQQSIGGATYTSGTSYEVQMLPSVTEGNTLVAIVAMGELGMAPLQTPTGWTAVAGATHAAEDPVYTFRKTAGAAEGNFTLTAALGSRQIAVALFEISGDRTVTGTINTGANSTDLPAHTPEVGVSAPTAWITGLVSERGTLVPTSPPTNYGNMQYQQQPAGSTVSGAVTLITARRPAAVNAETEDPDGFTLPGSPGPVEPRGFTIGAR